MQRITFILSFLIFTLSAVADTIYIAPGDNALYDAVNQSQTNDVIVLSSAQFGQMPVQRLRFIPIYFAGAIEIEGL